MTNPLTQFMMDDFHRPVKSDKPMRMRDLLANSIPKLVSSAAVLTLSSHWGIYPSDLEGEVDYLAEILHELLNRVNIIEAEACEGLPAGTAQRLFGPLADHFIEKWTTASSRTAGEPAYAST